MVAVPVSRSSDHHAMSHGTRDDLVQLAEAAEGPGGLAGRPHRDGRGQRLPHQLPRGLGVLLGLREPVGPRRFQCGGVGVVDRRLVVGFVEVGELVLGVLDLGLDRLVLGEEIAGVLEIGDYPDEPRGLGLEPRQLAGQVVSLSLAAGLQLVVLGDAALVLEEGLRAERLTE